jgi:hypothetical protein
MDVIIRILIETCFSSVFSKLISILFFIIIGFFGYAYFVNPEILKIAAELLKGLTKSAIK